MAGGKGGWLPTAEAHTHPDYAVAGHTHASTAAVAHKHVNASSGSTTINTSNTWANLSTHVASFSDITLTDCVAGDVLAITLTGMWQNDSSVGRMSVATIVGGTLTNYICTRSSTPSAGGVRGWHGPAGIYMPIGGTLHYAVTAADLSSGSITLRPRVNTGGSKVFFHDPGQFTASNLGPVQV